jgi:hypothetical protein
MTRPAFDILELMIAKNLRVVFVNGRYALQKGPRARRMFLEEAEGVEWLLERGLIGAAPTEGSRRNAVYLPTAEGRRAARNRRDAARQG